MILEFEYWAIKTVYVRMFTLVAASERASKIPGTSRAKRAFVPCSIPIGAQIAITSLATQNGKSAVPNSGASMTKREAEAPFRSPIVAAVREDREDNPVPEVGQISPVVRFARYPIVAVR